MRLWVVGIGPGGADELTLGANRKLKDAPHVVLRTQRHGIYAYLSPLRAVETLDALYESACDFDALHEAVAAFLVKAVQMHGEVAYGVPGHGAEEAALRAITRAAEASGIAVRCLAGISMAAPAPAAAVEAGMGGGEACAVSCSASYAETADFTTSVPYVIYEIYSPRVASSLKCRLLDFYPAAHRVLLCRGAAAKELPLCEMDHGGAFDHTCSVYVPPAKLMAQGTYGYGDLVGIMRRLRGAGGCPWDQEQTHESLRTNMIEEAYEAVEAIDLGEPEALCDELGDVLLQVVFHACIAEEYGEFDERAVTSAICRKLIRRHPHIFGDVVADTASEVLSNWDAIKREEKGQQSVAQAMADTPKGMPALMRAVKVQKKARNVGFDWEDVSGAWDKLMEEAQELRELTQAPPERYEEELGDLLFAVVNVARFYGVTPELALIRATGKFTRRFAFMEQCAAQQGKNMAEMALKEMDILWETAKKKGL